MARLDTIDRQVNELIRDDLVEPAASPWGCSVVFMRKRTVPIGYALTTELLMRSRIKIPIHFRI